MVWFPELRDYVAAQAVGLMGIGNETLDQAQLGARHHSNGTPDQPLLYVLAFTAETWGFVGADFDFSR